MKPFFTILHKNKKTFARTGVIHTVHGDIQTPTFVPVATKGTIKGLTIDQFKDQKHSSLLCNTYHLYLRPGDKRVKAFGGLHKFMGWDGPIWTDSGGFQVFSLGAGLEDGVGKIGGKSEEVRKKNLESLVKISEDGVEFRSHIDGSKHFFTPEKSMQIQKNLGADLIFAFDECTSPSHDYNYTKRSMDRTHRWAVRSLQEFKKLAKKSKDKQFLFGIVQGGDHKDLREKSAEVINAMDFPGIGIGGCLGDSKTKMYKILDWIMPYLDESKPRHLLGIGAVGDILEAVSRGIDTFDCVIPTRYGRNGTAFTREGVLHLKNARHSAEKGPLEYGCTCYTCSIASRGYISHLFRANEMLGPILTTIHNLAFMERLMREIREAIPKGKLGALKRKYKKLL